jgi:hypothetical protein
VNGNPTFSLAVTWIQLHNELITGVLTQGGRTGFKLNQRRNLFNFGEY